MLVMSVHKTPSATETRFDDPLANSMYLASICHDSPWSYEIVEREIIPYPAIRFQTDELDDERVYTVLVKPQYDLPTRTFHGYRVEAFHSQMVCDPEPLCTLETRPDAINVAADKMDELSNLV